MTAAQEYRNGIARRMVQALNEISTPTNTLVLVMFWAGFAHGEIAEASGLTLGRVNKRLTAAIKHLKRIIA